MKTLAKNKFMAILKLAQKGQIDKAIKACEKSLRTLPKDPNVLHLLAQLFEKKGEKDKAISFYRRAVDVHPDSIAGHFNLARILSMSGQAKHQLEAISIFKELLEEDPSNATFWEALAQTYQRRDELEECQKAWLKATLLNKENPSSYSQYLLTSRSLCDWSVELDEERDLIPHVAAILLDDPDKQRRAAQAYCAKHFFKIPTMPAPPSYEHDRVRIGYLSSDFHAHATSYLMAELFSMHDRDHFEVYAYSYGVKDGSEIRKRLESEAENFIDISNLTPQECATRIRADEIDILVDMKGHTAGARLDILAYRPAAIQMHWLGFPGTTGARFIDYFIGDSITIPPSHNEHFTEKVLRLPHCYQINDRMRKIGTPQGRAHYGLPEDAFVFACFNQTYKITPEIFDIWCDILKETKDSVLWLYESNERAAKNLRKEAGRRGVEETRLYFAKSIGHAEHLARYHVVDLVLDTFPVGGHTTTSDALWACAPVVSIAGKSFVSRVASSLLHAAGLPLLVTQNREEYHKRIMDLVNNKAARLSIRQHLMDKRKELPLFDTPRFVEDLEKGYLSCLETTATSSS